MLRKEFEELKGCLTFFWGELFEKMKGDFGFFILGRFGREDARFAEDDFGGIAQSTRNGLAKFRAWGALPIQNPRDSIGANVPPPRQFRL